MTATGRYCLNTCYCGNCPHWQPFTLTNRFTPTQQGETSR